MESKWLNSSKKASQVNTAQAMVSAGGAHGAPTKRRVRCGLRHGHRLAAAPYQPVLATHSARGKEACIRPPFLVWAVLVHATSDGK